MSRGLHAGVCQTPETACIYLICVEYRACLLCPVLTLYRWKLGLFTQEHKLQSCRSHRLLLDMSFQHSIWDLRFTFPRCLHMAWNYHYASHVMWMFFFSFCAVTFSYYECALYSPYIGLNLPTRRLALWTACFPCDLMGFLWMFQFIPTVLKHAGKIIWRI